LQSTNQINTSKQGGSYAAQIDGFLHRAHSVPFAKFGCMREGREEPFQKTNLFLQDNALTPRSGVIINKGKSNNETNLQYVFAGDHLIPVV
jgi:hypothetical protein